jgi:hypothetical protein
MEGKDPNLGVKPPKKKEQEKRENYIYKICSFEMGEGIVVGYLWPLERRWLHL